VVGTAIVTAELHVKDTRKTTEMSVTFQTHYDAMLYLYTTAYWPISVYSRVSE